MNNKVFDRYSVIRLINGGVKTTVDSDYKNSVNEIIKTYIERVKEFGNNYNPTILIETDGVVYSLDKEFISHLHALVKDLQTVFCKEFLTMLFDKLLAMAYKKEMCKFEYISSDKTIRVHVRVTLFFTFLPRKSKEIDPILPSCGIGGIVWYKIEWR